MNSIIHVRIKLFATARDMVGSNSLELDIPIGTTIQSLKVILMDTYSIPEVNLSGLIFSRNHEFVENNEILQENDEVGIFPPVSGGGSQKPTITRITGDDISVDELSKEITTTQTGAAVIFTGFVRGESPGTEHPRTDQLEYEAYEPMAIKKMAIICEEIRSEWPAVYGIYMVQRVGNLVPMDIAVAIGISSGHRDEGAFEAARYGIDRLKEIVPVWKKEIGPDGQEWVEGSFHPTKGS